MTSPTPDLEPILLSETNETLQRVYSSVDGVLFSVQKLSSVRNNNEQNEENDSECMSVSVGVGVSENKEE
jgi:hypothetical protein